MRATDKARKTTQGNNDNYRVESERAGIVKFWEFGQSQNVVSLQ